MIQFIDKPEVLESKNRNGQKDKKGMTSKIINIIRTTQRNNIELTAIVDNKANVLLTLNALMLTAIVPYVISNATTIMESFLYIPIIIATITCFATIYQAIIVLAPLDFDQDRIGMNPSAKPSPFFFGNFYQMDTEEYYEYIREGLSNPNLIDAHLAQDLYYVGKRLGIKMSGIRTAFTIFLIGLTLTLITIVLVLVIA